MRRSARPPEKYANLVSQAHVVTTAVNEFQLLSLSSKRSNIATLDNGTMVEAFKFLNYCQLAKNSLVSMRFRNVIQTHRHQLALLYVDSISMERLIPIAGVGFLCEIFDKKLSTEAYNEWVVRNNYSKEAPIENQVATTQSTEDISDDYVLLAFANYKEPYHRGLRRKFTFHARVKEINDDTWPVFEHFVHLLTDPFVYFRRMQLTSQNETFNLLASTYDRNNRGRLQCELMRFYFEDYTQKSFNWIKDHIRCVEFRCADCCMSPNCLKLLLDFFVTGSHCASKIEVEVSYISEAVIIDFVQKFMDLKSCDKSHMVHSIVVSVTKSTAELLKSNYAKFFISEKRGRFGFVVEVVNVFEIVNVDIGKKMRLSITQLSDLSSVFIHL